MKAHTAKSFDIEVWSSIVLDALDEATKHAHRIVTIDVATIEAANLIRLAIEALQEQNPNADRITVNLHTLH